MIATIAAATLTATQAQNVPGISVTPSELAFRSADQGMRVLVSGTAVDGEVIDLTTSARFEPSEPLVKLAQDGLLYAVRQGDTKVTATAAGKQAQLSVHVVDLSKPAAISFVRDVALVLNKIGCTSGTCHGSAKGKNGFKLSLRG